MAVTACFLLPEFALVCVRAGLPTLANQPLALVGDNQRILVCSQEAARVGVSSGQKLSGARTLCPGLETRPYDRPVYEKAAHPLWNLAAEESSFVEPESPEVCFVRMEGREALERCEALAARMEDAACTAVRLGLARSKFAARIAAESASGPRAVVVPEGMEASFLAETPLERAEGIPQAVRDRLSRLGVHTLGEALRLPARELQRVLKDLGHWLQRLAEGRDGDPVRPIWPPRILQRTLRFDDEVTDIGFLHEALRRCAKGIASALEVRREYGRSLNLRMLPDDRIERAEKLARPAADTDALYRAALRLLDRMPPAQPVSEVRLTVGEIGSGGGIQLVLLDENEYLHGLPHERAQKLETTVSFLRGRYGAPVVGRAQEMRRVERAQLWVCPLGHLLDEPIRVDTNSAGAPLRYWWRGSLREVARIQTWWREAEWAPGGGAPTAAMREREVYRVETLPLGFSELRHAGAEWRLTAMAD